MHKFISIEDKEEWNKSIKGINHSFAFTHENCHAMSLTTGYDTFLYCYQNKGVRIICPLSERLFNGNKDIVTPYGFSGFAGNKDCKEFKTHWTEFVKEKKYVCGYISMNPLFQNDSYFAKEDVFSNTNLYFIDLTQSLTELFENLDTNRKKIIVNYKKAESKFIYDKKPLTDFFINNYESFLRRISASKANYFSRDTLEYICSLDNVFMVGAGRSDIEAVYIFASTDHAADCLFNVATPEGREFSPLLLWCGIRHFKKKRIPVICLGGGLKDDDNVALSKERFGGYKLPFKNLKQVYNNEIYKRLCDEKGVSADEIEGYFPAYRK
ncbi:MAG TPA: hypothetical protein PKA90_15800 [Ignavibacteria bacterium]|nr:hypothetical protein [Ignavibacteria bacterium]HMR41882.1 hypothetical protein [Ignavibacteria bacterium]